jgi:micrococcal nuclease
MYEYRAIVTKIYDGDTITVDIDLGFGIWVKKQSIRLGRINADEIRGDQRESGLRVRDTLRGWLPIYSEVYLVTDKDKSGKYGRWIAEVFPYNKLMNNPDINTSYNSRLLLEEGVRPYGE